MQSYVSYINNNYFPEGILAKELPKLFSYEEQCQQAFKNVIELYNKHEYSSLNENQLEEELLKPILKLLNYDYITQESINVHGKLLKPDYLLFEDERNKSEYINTRSLSKILSIFEAKAWGVPLDGKKIVESPHMQLVQYNLFMGVPYGILSNGKEWRFYDLRERKSEKVFFEIDLEEIIKNKDYEAFRYFYYVFRKEYFISTENITPIVEITKAKQLFIERMENDLKEVIYGKNSIIEKIGQVLLRSYPDVELTVLFEHAMVMAYRLLFVAYFETQFKSYLFDDHDHYKNVALLTLFEKLYKGENCKAYQELTNLFDILDKGSVPFRIPLLNGGLFDLEKAPLFEYNKNKNLFTNEDLSAILTELLKVQEDSLGIRNFAMMSVTHIGNIYEGLLQYTFRMADEMMYYIEYKDKESKSGYFDEYDYQKISKKKGVIVSKVEEISQGTLYLVNRSNGRKSSASYYTPQRLSRFMVSDVVDSIMMRDKFQADILSVKIIDNACGSGHFLVDMLDELTEKVYANIADQYQYLQDVIDIEKNKITDNLENYNLEHLEIDELQILKRILLKKVIYGVDLQEFAVELTRLSLWLKTFIFGTPLSFIEHHIKQGNALIGSSIDEGESIFNDNQQDGLFISRFKDKFIELGEVARQLANLPDSTTKEIEESKKIYHDEIEPKQKDLAKILDLITYHKMKEACKKSKNGETFTIDTNNLLQNLEEEIYKSSNKNALAEILRVSDKYRYFHYDIAFPEMYGRGFDIVVGNPPWDKVKFDDKDFFPQYRSNYRIMSVNQKKELRENLLNSPSYQYIQDDYKHTMTWTNTSLAYYKAHYPLNGGAGDTNLFRLFIEKNLGILEKDGRLVYVTPSAWSYEEGSLQIRKHIIDNLQFNYFYQFENRNAIFPDVHRSYKFAIWSVNNTPKYNESVPCFFMEKDTDRLYPHEGKAMDQIHYPLALSRRHFPNSYIMLEINDEKDLTIIDQMYSVGKAINPNYIDFRRELDMTNDNDLFIEKHADHLMSLYEGKMIHQFNPNFANPQYWVDPQALKERLYSKEISRMVDSIFEQIPLAKDKAKSKEKFVLSYLGLQSRDDLKQFVKYDFEYPRMVFRAISANTNENTLIASMIVPNCTAGNSVWTSNTKDYILQNKEILTKEVPIERILWSNSCFNSIVMDFVLRFLVDINVNKTYLMQLPLIHATDEQLQTEPYATIWKTALALTAYKEPKFKDLAQQHGITIPKTDKAYDLLQIQNDIAIAKLYGITPDQMNVILDTFPVLAKNKPEFVAVLRSQAQNLG